MFTSRHYWFVAYIIRDGIKTGKLNEEAQTFLLKSFGDAFAQDNTRFKRNYFEHVATNLEAPR